MELLLRKQATDVNLTTNAGVSALHLAAGAGNSDIAQQLLQHGANPHVVDRSGVTPAEYAFEVPSTLIIVKCAGIESFVCVFTPGWTPRAGNFT